ncbi:MAG TPA: TonB-dependent receptor, partial [Gammaproteobacteria bacterium]
IELELTYKLSKTVNIDSNFSLLDSKDNNTGEPMPGSSDWIANIGLNIQPNSNTNLSIQFHAISEFYREAADTRSMLDGYNTTDFTLSIKDMFERDLSFRFGIKNLFNKDVRYPAPELTYIDDHPRAGSQWWMQLSYEF